MIGWYENTNTHQLKKIAATSIILAATIIIYVITNMEADTIL